MSQHKRKLAAIVFTDIVGFTKLTADDQSKAANLLTEQRNLLQPIVDSHNGSWIKEMGDGLLLIFDTVTDAVNCTIKIQEVTKEIAEVEKLDKPKRSRGKKGRYLSDDPTTKDVNEAWVGGKAPKKKRKK